MKLVKVTCEKWIFLLPKSFILLSSYMEWKNTRKNKCVWDPPESFVHYIYDWSEVRIASLHICVRVCVRPSSLLSPETIGLSHLSKNIKFIFDSGDKSVYYLGDIMFLPHTVRGKLKKKAHNDRTRTTTILGES